MSQNLSILIVEDDPTMRAIIALALSLDRAIAVTPVGSGADALAVVSDRPDAFDAVLLDPASDHEGIATIEALGEVAGTSPIPIIVLTAASGERLDAYAEAGATAIIAKPFDPITLAQDLRRCLDSA